MRIENLLKTSVITALLVFPGCLTSTGLRCATTGDVEVRIRAADTAMPISGVMVTIEGLPGSAITDSKGICLLPNIPAGLWTVRAERTGYQTVVTTNLRAFAGETVKTTFLLESTIVELPERVVEKRPAVATGGASTKHVMTSGSMQALPVDSYRDLVTLQAGTVRIGDALDPQYAISVRGGRPGENIVYIDGIDVRRYETDQNLLDVPEFGIEEIDLLPGNPSAEYGGAQSGVINIVTRTGGFALSGGVRFETEELNPSSSNYGFNQLQFNIGGPVPVLDNLTFFLSGDAIGQGDRRPRASGFKGTTDDLFDVAARYSNSAEVRDWLGHDLDLVDMMNGADAGLPIMNLTDLRKRRFGGKDFEGRLPGDQGDELRFHGKATWRPLPGTSLMASFFEDREQGIIFDRSRMFWTEERNQGYVNRNRLAIFGVDHTFGTVNKSGIDVSFRAGIQRFERHNGDLFAPFDSTSARITAPGVSEGYHDQSSFMNFMFGDVPIFADDLFAQSMEQAERFQGVTQADSQRGDNPFGVQMNFRDQNKGFNDFIYNNREDRNDFRVDIKSRFRGRISAKAGAEVKTWNLDKYSSNLSTSTFLDYSHAEPDMESFYLQSRMELDDLLIDLGLRLDSFYAGADYPVIFGNQYSGKTRPNRKTEAAPSLGASVALGSVMSLRCETGISYQVPQFSNLYDAINVDIDEEGSTSAVFGNPDLRFRKTTFYEIGATALFLEDWALDLAFYNKDFERNVAARYVLQEQSARYVPVFTNDDVGNARGLDVALRKRFGEYLSANLAYSLLRSEGTGNNPEDFVRNEGRFVVGDSPPLPPVEKTLNDFDQTHTVDLVLDGRFPGDFMRGKIAGMILSKTGCGLTFQAHSGRPYATSGGYEFVEDIENSESGWASITNLRLTKGFALGGLDYTLFADIRNLFGAVNLSANQADAVAGSGVVNGLYQTSGSPYTDGNTISDALDYMGLSDPGDYVSPNDPSRTPSDIDGDGDQDEADREELIRRLDINGDGTVTVEEELAMAILSSGAYDADSGNFDIPRLFRIGVEVRF